MKKIAIVTESNSGITQAQAKTMGIYVVPMPFFIDEKLLFINPQDGLLLLNMKLPIYTVWML